MKVVIKKASDDFYKVTKEFESFEQFVEFINKTEPKEVIVSTRFVQCAPLDCVCTVTIYDDYIE